jgi:hypothetical protein
MTNILHRKSDQTTLSRYAYGYDDAGRRIWVQRANGRGDVYRYDATDQLTNVLYEPSTRTAVLRPGPTRPATLSRNNPCRKGLHPARVTILSAQLAKAVQVCFSRHTGHYRG